MMARRSIEPLVWILFSVGGVVAAMFIPVLLFLFGFAYPLGWLESPSYAHLVAVVGHPLVRVLLFFMCTLCLLHAAHRFPYTLYDGLQLQQRIRGIDPSVMLVSMKPGATALTRTPWGPTSVARTLVSWTSAALAMP